MESARRPARRSGSDQKTDDPREPRSVCGIVTQDDFEVIGGFNFCEVIWFFSLILLVTADHF